MVGDREFYNAAAELTRIMGTRIRGASSTILPRSIRKTGQLLYPLPAPPNAAAGFQIAGAAGARRSAGSRFTVLI